MALLIGGTAAARRRKLAIFAERSDSWAGDHLLSKAVRVRQGGTGRPCTLKLQ
jgi:hypothetical protein